MKILAIRGKNLASLAGDFEVNFQREPLASAGLFAITGATGAGKSTLLDALCLALYNKTPRLARISNKTGVDLLDVGSHTLKIHDTKNILRRGAVDGFAEVDFVGNDRRHYRAKWSLWRARNQSNGALQDENMSLCQLPDLQPLGHKKTEVLPLIQSKIGLSFEEFNRAVLLAQNEFFAFLKADDNERAALLEALTGSQHFTELSKQAHARNKLEKDNLQRLQESLSHQLPMATEARQELEHELLTLTMQLQQEQEQHEQLSTQLLWYNTRDSLQQHVQTAEAALTLAQQQWQATSARQHYLQQIEQVQDARPVLVQLQQLQTTLAAQRLTLTQNQQELTLKQQQEHNQQQLATQLQTQHTNAQQHYEQARPALEQAKKLDIQLESQDRLYQQAQQHLELAKKNLGQSRYRELVNWDKIKELFSSAQNHLQLAGSQQALQLAQQAQQSYQQQLADTQRQLKTIDIDNLRQQHSSLIDQQRQLQTAEQKWQQWLDGQSQHQQLQHEQENIQQQLRHTQQRLQAIGEQLPELTGQHTQAQQTFELAKMACSKDVEGLRQQLRDDQPCPVCGSEQHPYSVDHNSRLHQLLAQLEQTHKNLQQQLQHLSTEQAQLQGTQTGNQHQHQQNAAKLQALAKQQARLHNELLTLPLLSGQWVALESAERQDWLNTRQQQLTGQVKTLEQQDALYRQLQAAREQLQQLLDASVLVEKCAVALNDFVQTAHARLQLQQQRQQFFAGEASSTIEQRLLQQIQHSQQQAQSANQTLQQLTRQRTQAETAVSIGQQQEQDYQQTLESCQQQLTDWLTQFNRQNNSTLDLTQLQRLLDHDQAWIKQEQQALQSLHTAISSAQANVDARCHDLSNHLHQSVSSDKITLQNDLATLKASLPQHQQLLGQYQLQIRQDNERRQHTSTLQQQLEQQRQRAEIWAQLNDVIGANDGKKFRNAAQEMTLDVLLFHTNEHLKDLARRYRLQRVKQTLGLQVIDQDMGDEVRSVHSLSGGESFLVSLALALGLASLSSQRVNVESLFIDEGFGSLDAETLRTAMDALDILQGQGRKVGVISHVAEMTERIPVQIHIRKGAGGHSKVVVPEG